MHTPHTMQQYLLLYLHDMLIYGSLWQVDASLLLIGAITGILIRVPAAGWKTAAVLFVMWGLLFESSLAIGLAFTPYGGPQSYVIHLLFMLFRIPFAIGMICGILLSAEWDRWRRHRRWMMRSRTRARTGTGNKAH